MVVRLLGIIYFISFPGFGPTPSLHPTPLVFAFPSISTSQNVWHVFNFTYMEKGCPGCPAL